MVIKSYKRFYVDMSLCVLLLGVSVIQCFAVYVPSPNADVPNLKSLQQAAEMKTNQGLNMKVKNFQATLASYQEFNRKFWVMVIQKDKTIADARHHALIAAEHTGVKPYPTKDQVDMFDAGKITVNPPVYGK